MQEGRRKPYSASVALRLKSPRNMPPICGMATWLSSTKTQGIVRQVFKEGGRRLAGFAPGEIARIVFDAGAGAGGHHHLDIEVGALLEALGFEQAAGGIEFGEADFKVALDAVHGLFQGGLGRHVVGVGIDFHLLEFGGLLAGERIEFGNVFDLVAEEGEAPGAVLEMGGEEFHRVAADAEGAADEISVVALVVEADEIGEELALRNAFALLHGEGHGGIGFDIADAIDAGDGGDDDDVIALEQRPGGGVAHAVDLLVDGAFLLDEGVGAGDIGFRRVVIVIGDEIFHGVFREEGGEFAIELGGERLVRRQHEGGALGGLDDLGDGEGFARAGDAEENLVALLGIDAVHQLGDGGGLVALGLKGRDDFEGAAAIGFGRLGRAEGDEIGLGGEFRADQSRGCHGDAGIARNRLGRCFGKSAVLS